nr:MV entry/fusion complex protein [Oriental turtle dovepox virus]
MIVTILFLIMFFICVLYSYHYLKPWIFYVEREIT